MAYIGILGGMGPLATVNFISKLVEMTPASRDQEHIPYTLVNLPQIPDRSEAILRGGVSPLPMILKGLESLMRVEVGAIAIPCNTCHHWFEDIVRNCSVPVMDMAKISIERVPFHARTLLLATEGTIRSGFYQRGLSLRGINFELPRSESEQGLVDTCIKSVKTGNLESAGDDLRTVLSAAQARAITHVILACTELPLALRFAGPTTLTIVDTTEELARAVVAFAVERGWTSPNI